ncbi:hypothetical protein OOR52_09455 [Dehalogenimonas etheniformans]|nr:hypothetical protein [Dehalogenimonas etheniformans]
MPLYVRFRQRRTDSGIRRAAFDGVYRAGFNAVAAAIADSGIYYDSLPVFVYPDPQPYAKTEADFVISAECPNFEHGICASGQAGHPIFLALIVEAAFTTSAINHRS